jgi:hypothetical protein
MRRVRRRWRIGSGLEGEGEGGGGGGIEQRRRMGRWKDRVERVTRRRKKRYWRRRGWDWRIAALVVGVVVVPFKAVIREEICCSGGGRASFSMRAHVR